MPSAVSPDPLPLPKWKRPAKTKENLDWADIKVIDLSNFDEPGVKEKLAGELRDAVCLPHYYNIVMMFDDTHNRFTKLASSASLAQVLRPKK